VSLFLVRMIHGFTSTGLTETQYINYSKAANIGYVEEKYISTGRPVCDVYIYLSMLFAVAHYILKLQ